MTDATAGSGGTSFAFGTVVIVGVMIVAQIIIQGLLTLRMRKLKVTYDEVPDDAKLSNTLLVGTNVATCYFCYKLEMNTWRDANVKAALNEHAVKLVRVKPACMRAYCIRNNIKQGSGIPFILLIGKTGKCIGTIDGYREPSVMLGVIKKYFPLSGEDTNEATNM